MIPISLTREQLSAMRARAVLGRTLQKDLPDVADLWRQGRTLVQIAEELDIRRTYNIYSEAVASEAIRYALNGHPGGLGVDTYDGLIGEDEREKLLTAHRRATGFLCEKRGVGIHAKTSKERSENGRKGGLEAAKTLDRSPKKARARGIRGVIAKGDVPWSEEETQRAYQLSQDPRYVAGSRVRIGNIAEELNKAYHESKPIRKSKSVDFALRRYKMNVLGYVPAETNPVFSDEEKKFAYSLSQDPYFMNGPRVSNVRVAQAMNGYFHGGREVRTMYAVSTLLNKFRKDTGTANRNLPYSDEEKRFAYSLSQDPDFRKGSVVNSLPIAQAMNGYFHQGNEVRTTRRVSKMLTQFRKDLGIKNS